MFSSDCYTVATLETRPSLPAFTISQVSVQVAVIACAMYCGVDQNCYGAAVTQGPGRGEEYTCTVVPSVTTAEMEHSLITAPMYIRKVCPARMYYIML